jgi:hypothetical protein
MIETFLAGFLGVVVGVGVVAFLFFRLYKEEQRIAKDLSDKFLRAVSGEDPAQSKKGQKVDFLSLIKNSDKEPPVN